MKRRYISRRTKDYDDGDSQGEEDYSQSNYKATGEIVYKDTKGNETVLKPNSRFLNYKSSF